MPAKWSGPQRENVKEGRKKGSSKKMPYIRSKVTRERTYADILRKVDADPELINLGKNVSCTIGCRTRT